MRSRQILALLFFFLANLANIETGEVVPIHPLRAFLKKILIFFFFECVGSA